MCSMDEALGSSPSPIHTKCFSSSRNRELRTLECGVAWWCTPVSPVLGRLRQEECKFEASLGEQDLISEESEDKKRERISPCTTGAFCCPDGGLFMSLVFPSAER